jgi:hypothetical protein
MKLFIKSVMSAGLVVVATAAQAQVLVPYGAGKAHVAVVSDVGGPYAQMPEGAPVPGYGPTLLPPQEVYTVLRENGFSPLGIPQQRGLVYTIAVIDRGGDSGRLVIDARTGRIVRFMPAPRIGDGPNGDLAIYGPVGPGPVPPYSHARAMPRPPLSIPRVAGRTPPVPRPSPLAAKPAADPAAQSAAVQAKPAEVPAAPPPMTTGAVPAKPAPQIAPTQEMPKAQGLD